MAEFSNSSGNTRLMTCRFSSMYDTPEGTRRLSSSTYTVPSLSRIRSEPQMCAQMPSGGFTPWQEGAEILRRVDDLAGHPAVA